MKENKKLQKHTIGVDIGGTNMKAVLFDGQKVIADYSLATPKENLNQFLTMLKALIDPLLEKAKKEKIKVDGLGLSIAGPVDFNKQIITKAPNIPILNEVKLGKELEDKIGLPAIIDNDGNCFVRAEAKLGTGKKYSNFYGLTIGTSIGSAWWFNNEVYRGIRSGAGEVAHLIINCSEYISLEKAYQHLTQNNPAQLAEEAYRGDSLAQKSYKEIGGLLGTALANIVNILDPEVFIIGGGVIESSDLFLAKIKKTMREYIMNTESKKIKIIKSELGDQAGAIGAALLV